MKKIIPFVFVAALSASPALAEPFLYGNCKPVKGTEFYRCLSLNDQITYTNILPSPEDAAAYKKARIAQEPLRRKAAQAQVQRKSEPGKTEVIVEAPKQEPAKEQPKVEPNPCDETRARLTGMMNEWGDLALLYAQGNKSTSPRMTILELSIGHMIEGSCFAEKK